MVAAVAYGGQTRARQGCSRLQQQPVPIEQIEHADLGYARYEPKRGAKPVLRPIPAE